MGFFFVCFFREICESKGCTIDKKGKNVLESHKFLHTLNKWPKKDDYQNPKNKV